jgi:hypothetical protein
MVSWRVYGVGKVAESECCGCRSSGILIVRLRVFVAVPTLPIVRFSKFLVFSCEKIEIVLEFT